MDRGSWRGVIGYGAVAALTLVCLWLASLSPLRADWGRELRTAAITLVAVAVGMALADRRSTAAPPLPLPPPPPGPAAPPADDGLLTPRERQILRHLDQGLTIDISCKGAPDVSMVAI